jgi:hypothetical protein
MFSVLSSRLYLRAEVLTEAPNRAIPLIGGRRCKSPKVFTERVALIVCERPLPTSSVTLISTHHCDDAPVLQPEDARRNHLGHAVGKRSWMRLKMIGMACRLRLRRDTHADRRCVRVVEGLCAAI